MVVNKSQTEIVKSIFADYISGVGIYEIAKRLNEQGILTKKKWPLAAEYNQRNSHQ